MSQTDKLPFDKELSDAVHVWTVQLDSISPADLAVLGECLDQEETVRGRRFHCERDRRHFTATRGWLRRLLGRYLAASADELVFSYGERGKPYIRSPVTNLRFNLSHSHGRAMFAFAEGREVGIDLEAGARLGNEWPSLVRRVFSGREQAELAALPAEKRRAGFLNGWTRKEAYLKATGLGIVDGLQSIEVTLGPEVGARVLAGPAGSDWKLYDLRLDDDFAAALAVQAGQAITVTRLDCGTNF